jgi:glycosyltransferase 2 family protein
VRGRGQGRLRAHVRRAAKLYRGFATNERSIHSAHPLESRRIRSLVSLVLGITLFALLVAALDEPAAAFAALAEVKPVPVAAALAAYVGVYLCRAARFRALLGKERAPLGDTTAICAVHNLMNMLLPVRTGEVSWIMLAEKRLGIRLAEGTASLLLSRLYDMIGIAVFFLVAFVVHRSAAESSARWIGGALALLLVSALALAALGPLLNLALSRLRVDAPATSFAAKLRRALESLRTAVAESRRRGDFIAVFAITEAQWFFTFVTCFALLRACPGGEELSFAGSIVGSTGLSLALILPINPVGNVGTFQAGWIAGYLLAGLDQPTATASAIVAHAAILLFAAGLGLIGHVYLRSTTKGMPTSG